MKVILVIFGAALICVTVSSEHNGSLVQQAPRKFAQLRNPDDGDRAAIEAGRKLFQRECAACHGKDARGVSKAPPLVIPDVYRAAPGALFWALRNGSLKRGMPSYAHLPEQQRWQIVSFLKEMTR